MLRIQVALDENIKESKSIKEVLNQLPEEQTSWEKILSEACERKADELVITGYKISDTNSENFQILGPFFRILNRFLHQNENPKTIRVLCSNSDAVRMYRVVYNFYIPATKADRMPDEGWD